MDMMPTKSEWRSFAFTTVAVMLAIFIMQKLG
jgi:hypothetical protein